MKPTYLWEDPVEIDAGRTCDYKFKLYQPNGKPAAIVNTAVVRFKLCQSPDDATPLLDIDSIAPLAGGSVVTINSRGTQDVTPASVTVRFAQADTKRIVDPTTSGGLGFECRDDYFGELGVVDTAETNPLNAFKRAGYGPVTLKPSPGGDIGIV